jgi:hypothetical protein
VIEHEHVNEKTVALSIKATKLTGRALAKAMRAFLKKASQPGKPSHGKQSVKNLTKQGASLSNIEVADQSVDIFKRTARKYNIDFAMKKDNAGNPPKWIVFFKAKDADALTAAFNEYSKKTLAKTKKPSLLARINKIKELAKSIATPVKNRSRGGHEL